MPDSNATPEGAVERLIEAYRSLDIDRIAGEKDFDLDSKIHWQILGLPVSEEQLLKSAKAFETNFRNKLKENGIPDFRAIRFSILGSEPVGKEFVVVRIEATDPKNRAFASELAVFRTGKGWKVALHPDYAHF